jgi:hypothetical protein
MPYRHTAGVGCGISPPPDVLADPSSFDFGGEIMKRALLSVLSLVLMIGSMAAPAFANGSAQGKYLAISVQGLPEVCPAGQAMEGKLTIALAKNAGTGRQVVTFEVTVDTPFGDVTVFEQTFRMRPGTEHSQYISIPVPKETPTGQYYFDFQVSVRQEAMEVGHEVFVTK